MFDNKYTFIYNGVMSKKKTHQEFMKQAKSKLSDYDVLTNYDGATVPMKFRCRKCGFEFSIRPNSFLAHGCRKCAYASNSGKISKSFKEWRKQLDKKYDNYEFSNFTGATKPITAKCLKCGREHTYYTAKAFTNGIAGCKSCGASKDRQHWIDLCDKWDLDFVKKNGKNILVQCRKCGRESYKLPCNLWKNGCKYCVSYKKSKDELKLLRWIRSVVPNAISGDRSILSNRLELDIYCPDQKVAIEYNGRFWHSTSQLEKRMSRSDAKKYHYNKSIACRKKGIRLIHVWDYEWQDEKKQRVLKNIILGALGKLPERYYARNCTVSIVKQGDSRWEEMGRFFEDNNIQGNRGGRIVFALEHDGKVLMAYKFGSPSGGKAKKLYEWEMVRGASAPGVQVVGGASKLWKHFIDYCKPKSVVYYVDFNYFDGKSVEKLGLNFVRSQIGVKNYWTKENKVTNRMPSKHKEIKELVDKGEVLELHNAGTLVYEL